MSDRARGVGSVARAAALLDALADADAGLGVSELARRIEVNPSTASRLLATLQDAGLVAREPGGSYRLGLRLVELADHVLAQLDVRTLARPLLMQLVAETEETATVSLPAAGDAVTVDFVPSPRTVVSMARVGRPSISHATAVGKVMLAFGRAGPDPRRVPRRLAAFTARTIVDPDQLVAEVAAVRERGWAEADGEREPELAAIAAPAFDRHGEMAAIIGLQGPASRLPAARRAQLCEPLLRAADGLSGALGGSRS